MQAVCFLKLINETYFTENSFLVIFMKVCGTCNREVAEDYVEFRCPACAKSAIVRCFHCRQTVKSYKCPECGFEGP